MAPFNPSQRSSDERGPVPFLESQYAPLESQRRPSSRSPRHEDGDGRFGQGSRPPRKSTTSQTERAATRLMRQGLVPLGAENAVTATLPGKGSVPDVATFLGLEILDSMVCLTSPRPSAETVIALLDKTECSPVMLTKKLEGQD